LKKPPVRDPSNGRQMLDVYGRGREPVIIAIAFVRHS
jgi:hypothetical protein